MAEPSYLSGGTTPRNTDTRLRRWVRILGAYQNAIGSSAANNPHPRDTLRRIKVKLARVLNS